MVKSASKPPLPTTFEDALSELETLVQTMERGDLALEASLTAYQRGVSLLRYCQERLGAAEETVRVLEGDELRPLADNRLAQDSEED